ncbi:MAG: peptidoglycan DD-metalloendopeptidase family protein [Flavobacteriaceae bacterium]|nr:peptidoglycan DD-metalloendopeptidase family protein [Flavobacteriaceae bacterium]
MRLVAFSLILFLTCFYGFSQSQQASAVTGLDHKLKSGIFVKGLPTIGITLPNGTKTKELKDIKASHWDTNRFNPFKDEILTYPFKLTFDDSLYAAPVNKDMVITSRYGWRWGRAHQGIDIDLITGDEVVSMLPGIVRFVGYNSGHGKSIIVRHFNGLETTYAHLSKYAVKVNDTVQMGELLGKGGATGNARGSHLHLIVSYKGTPIHPEYLFNFTKNKGTIRAKEIWVTKTWTRPYFHSSRQRSKLELLKSKDEALASLTKEKEIYVVKKGDTLSRISRRNGVTIRTICVANNIKTTSVLRIGQKLVLDL